MFVEKAAYRLYSQQQYKGVKLTPSGMVSEMSTDKDICFGILINNPDGCGIACIKPLFSGDWSYIGLGEDLQSGVLVTINKSGVAVALNSKVVASGLLESGGEAGDLGKIRLGTYITPKGMEALCYT